MNAASLPVLWANCVERLKDRVNNRSFWEALEATHAITIENDILIIGMDPENLTKATHIQQTSTLNTVHRTVEEVFGKKLQLRIIEGTTLTDWEATKERDAKILAMKQAPVESAPVAASPSDSWEAVYEQLGRLYALAQHRSLPQGKARYANEALYLLVEAMDSIYKDSGDDATERSLARALDRISANTEIPASVLAFEMERLRTWRKASETE